VGVEESSGVCPNCGGELEISIAAEKPKPEGESRHGQLFVPTSHAQDEDNELLERRRSRGRLQYRKNKRRYVVNQTD